MDAAKRKLVEVFIDTDSESESHTSSEMASASFDAGEDQTGTAEGEVGVVSDEVERMVSPELSQEEGKFLNMCCIVMLCCDE